MAESLGTPTPGAPLPPVSEAERSLLLRLRGQHLTAVGWIEQRLGLVPTSQESGRRPGKAT